MSLIANERTKLLANALDRASTACLTVGVLGPSAAALYGVGVNVGAPALLVATGSLFWLAAAAVLHWIVGMTLGRLK